MLVGPSHAHDHVAPDAVLRLGDQRQTGIRYDAQWVDEGESSDCTAEFVGGFPLIGKALRHATGEVPVVRLRKRAAPLEVVVQRWPRINRAGYARGEPIQLPWTLEPHVVGDSVKAWDVVIPWPATAEHLYLGVSAYWADEAGCGGFPDLGSQYAAWTFHLKKP
jgi:hypothetical protein